MVAGACCDPAIQAAVSDVQGGNYAGSPRLQARLVADYADRQNWAYDPKTNACTWTEPLGAFYTLDSGAPASVMSPVSVDANHYGGGCTVGGVPARAPAPLSPPAQAAASSPLSYALLAGAGAAILWYLLK